MVMDSHQTLPPYYILFLYILYKERLEIVKCQIRGLCFSPNSCTYISFLHEYAVESKSEHLFEGTDRI